MRPSIMYTPAPGQRTRASYEVGDGSGVPEGTTGDGVVGGIGGVATAGGAVGVMVAAGTGVAVAGAVAVGDSDLEQLLNIGTLPTSKRTAPTRQRSGLFIWQSAQQPLPEHCPIVTRVKGSAGAWTLGVSWRAPLRHCEAAATAISLRTRAANRASICPRSGGCLEKPTRLVKTGSCRPGNAG